VPSQQRNGKTRSIHIFISAHKLETALSVVLLVFLCTWDYGQSMWLDEGTSVSIARKSISDIPGYVAENDVHPPGYYMALSIWMRLSSSVEWCRMFSVTMYLLSAVAVVFIQRQIRGNERSAVLYGFLLLSASLSYAISHEIRMYSMLMFGCAWALYFQLRYERRENWIAGLLASVFALMSLFTHYYAFIFVGGFIIVLAFRKMHSKVELIRMVAPLLVASAIFALVWGRQANAQFSQNSAGLRESLSLLALPVLALRIFAYPLGKNLVAVGAAIGYAVLLLSMTKKVDLLAFFKSLSSQVFLVQVALLFAAGLLIHNVFNDRLAVVLIPSLVVALGIRRVRLENRPQTIRLRWEAEELRKCAVVILVAVSLVSITQSYSQGPREDWKSTVLFIEKHEEAADVILFPFESPYAVFEYYYQGNSSAFGLLHSSRDLNESSAILLVDLYCSGHTRAWYILYLSSFYDPNEFILSALQMHFNQSVTFAFKNVEVTLFSS